MVKDDFEYVLLVVVVELSDLGGDVSDLRPPESVLLVQDGPVGLLVLPQLGVDVEGPAEVALPLLLTVRGQVPQAVEELATFFEERNKLLNDSPVIVLHNREIGRRKIWERLVEVGVSAD